MPSKFIPSVIIAGLIAGLSALPASAENPHGKVYDSWRIQCNSPTGAPSSCRMFQNIIVKDSREPILRFFVGYAEESKAPIGLIVVPLGMNLASGITFKIDDGQTYELAVEVCLPNGCQARFGFDENFLDLFKRGNGATVTFFGGNQQPFNIPVSLKGFTAALDTIH